MEPELCHVETEDYAEVKLEAAKLITESIVTLAHSGRDLGVHGTVLRRLVKDFAGGPVQAGDEAQGRT